MRTWTRHLLVRRSTAWMEGPDSKRPMRRRPFPPASWSATAAQTARAGKSGQLLEAWSAALRDSVNLADQARRHRGLLRPFCLPSCAAALCRPTGKLEPVLARHKPAPVNLADLSRYGYGT